MDKDFQKAKEKFNTGKYTLVICKDFNLLQLMLQELGL